MAMTAINELKKRDNEDLLKDYLPTCAGDAQDSTARTTVKKDSKMETIPSQPMVRFTLDDHHMGKNEAIPENNVTPTPTDVPITRQSSFQNNNPINHVLNRRPSALKVVSLVTPHSFFDKLESAEMKPWIESLSARSSLLSVLSAIYALILVILSLAFEVSGLVNNDVNSSRYDMFYIYLYLVGLLFFAYCYLFLMRTKGWNVPVPFYRPKRVSSKRSSSSDTPSEIIKLPHDIPLLSAKRKVTHSAKNAGSFYLRLGAIVFGIVGLIDRALQIYQAADSGLVPWCYDGLNIFEDIVAMIFIFVQLYFMFQNAKLTIHRFKEVGRFGTMHLIAANVCTWIRAVAVEEYHIIHEIQKSMGKTNGSIHSDIGGGNHHSSNNHAPAGHHSDNLTSDVHHLHVSHHINCETSHHDEMDDLVRHAKPFMTTCLIEYALICAAVSYIMWRNIGNSVRKRSKFRKQNFQIDCSSSTKGLFVGLLFVIITLVSMVIFFTKVRLERNKEALWVFYFSDCILYVASITALTVASYKMRKLYYVPHHKGLLLDDILLIIALVGQLMFCIFSIIALTKWELTSFMIVVVSLSRMIEVLMQTVFILIAQRLVAMTPDMQANKPGREMITFLLLANLAMFLINTFETQKAGANPLTMDFYGQSIWTVIVHSTAPLSIFYRFHSSVCFAEIWKTVYRIKEPEHV